jgi:hypothetical protein
MSEGVSDFDDDVNRGTYIERNKTVLSGLKGICKGGTFIIRHSNCGVGSVMTVGFWKSWVVHCSENFVFFGNGYGGCGISWILRDSKTDLLWGT